MNFLISRIRKRGCWPVVASIFFALPAFAQELSTLTLERAYELAEQHYPLIRQRKPGKENGRSNYRKYWQGLSAANWL